MIILISSDGDTITALDVPSDIQSELGRYLAPGVVMVATSSAESQHAMTVKVHPASAEAPRALQVCGDGESGDALPDGTVIENIDDSNGGGVVFIEAVRDNDRDAPALWVCAQEDEQKPCSALFDVEHVRQLHSALSSWLMRYRTWVQGRRGEGR